MTDTGKRVVFLTPIVTHYRVRFHEGIRVRLAAAGVRYQIISGVPGAAERTKGDTVDLPWVTRVPEHRLALGGGHLSYHPVLNRIRGADLVVLMQENKHLLNYLLQMLPRGLRPRLAVMGHGRNFQAREPNSRAERWKRFWATKADWWFGYTEETRRHLVSLGFPAERITVFNNSVDTGELRRLAAAVTPGQLAERRRDLDLQGNNIGIFVGGLYEDKRLDFLVDAAVRVRAAVPDFELIVVGGGPDLDRLRALAAPHAWIKVLGPRFGADKVELMRLATLFLMPGLVGLAVLDAFVVGLPIVTTAFPWHSPEIAYLEDGVNGIIVRPWEDVDAYAGAVAALLSDDARRTAMATAARAASERYTIEAMAERFAEGVLKALA